MDGDKMAEGGGASGDGAEFERVFAQVVTDLTQDHLRHPEIGDAIARLKQVLEYNTPGGKRNRGLSVIASFRALAPPQRLTDSSLRLTLILGWCVELLQAFFLVADDIMDQSVTRRGQPCWYRKEGIGLDAINDSYLLESSVYLLLRRHLRAEPCYVSLLELFLQTSYQTELGQSLDLMTAQPSHVNLEQFTETRYKAIVKYKTAFYSFYLPVAAAMYMAGIDGEEEHRVAQSILLEMGEFFQIQDDFLDCFGDPEVTGKVGTDIEDNKCSWLVVQALTRASPAQRRLLEEDYGRREAESVARVKALYGELGLRQAFHQYEEQSYQRLCSMVTQQGSRLPPQVFLAFADRIYKRKK